MTWSRTSPNPRLSTLPNAITAAAPSKRRLLAGALLRSGEVVNGIARALRVWLRAARGDPRAGGGALRGPRRRGQVDQHPRWAGALRGGAARARVRKPP